MAQIEFDVFCECGKELTTRNALGGIEVEPCQDCRDESYNEGFSDGKEDADAE